MPCQIKLSDWLIPGLIPYKHRKFEFWKIFVTLFLKWHKRTSEFDLVNFRTDFRGQILGENFRNSAWFFRVRSFALTDRIVYFFPSRRLRWFKIHDLTISALGHRPSASAQKYRSLLQSTLLHLKIRFIYVSLTRTFFSTFFKKKYLKVWAQMSWLYSGYRLIIAS